MVKQGEPEGRDGRTPGQPEERAVYIISVAAELAGVHPQTLRIYERKGLLTPARTAGNSRRYSQRDILRLQTIQRLTQDYGINLAGVKMIVQMENELERMRRQMERMDRELSRVRRRVREEAERAQRGATTADLVPMSSLRRLLLELGMSEGQARPVRSPRRGPIPVGPAT
jgi:MerR family transcriptional regulator/heat shock protein HspR